LANSKDKGGEPSRDLREDLSNFSPHDQQFKVAHALGAWATLLVIVVNVVVFIAMVVTFATVMGFNSLQLAVWGGNSGTLDLSGQWWRLLTYQFLHANILHIAINMWVMWSVGRMTERLCGGFTLLFIYLIAGTLAGLASIVWNPIQISVGASGSIFGVLGAFLAILLRSRNEVPLSILRYWFPALLFAGYNLFAGAHQQSVDNAAHVGGLVAGFGLGVIFARSPKSGWSFPLGRSLAAMVFAAACALPALWYLGAFDHRQSELQAFAASHRWYMEEEGKNLQLWQNLAVQIGAGAISNDEAAAEFERNIVPFWKNANARLQQELKQPGHSKNFFLPDIANFAALRFRWAQAIVALMRNNNPQTGQAVLDIAQQTQLEQSSLDRLKLRGEVDNAPLPLSESAFVNWVRSLMPGFQQQCIGDPAFMRDEPSPADAADDGPAQRHAVGCMAQQLFMRGDYLSLDAMMSKYSRNLSDLPDGSSRLEGVWNGLDDLLNYGTIPVEDAMRRTLQWRRAVKGSVEPDLFEVMMFRDWAYAARGHGYVSSVTPQAMQLYTARAAMAAAELHGMAVYAADNPAWYSLSLSVERDQSVASDKQLALFDDGTVKFRDYLPLYRQMLTTLMPRWGGSTQAVDEFVRDASTKLGEIDAATYARLYLIYGGLEGDDYNVLASANADPAILTRGMQELHARYPRSDYITNSIARFACLTGDVSTYRTLRPLVDRLPSTTAWPGKLSIAKCDQWSK
jgi:membrane associated rhomboid family serine protease